MIQRIRWLSVFVAPAALVFHASCSSQVDIAADGETPSVARQGQVAEPPGSPLRGDGDWSGFRGSGRMGIASGADLPVEWSSTESVLWKTPLPGSGASSPVVAGDHIYVTAYTGYFESRKPDGSVDKLKRHLIAMGREDGQIAWDQAVPAKMPEETSIRDHGYAANTVAVDAERVYAFFGKSGVFAFDHQGNQLWHADVGAGTNGWGTAASPLLCDDLVVVNASVESESLVALNRATGEERWRAEGVKESWNTPILVTTEAGDEELVVARHGDVMGFDPRTGQSLWTCKTDIQWYMVPTGVAQDGIVYYFGGRSGVAALAVRAGGRGDVTASHRLWTSETGTNVPSPILSGGRLYWASDKLGIVYCANAATGDLLYEQRLERAGQIYASPLLADGRLYYLTRSGKMFVVRLGPNFEQLAVNDLNDGSVFDATPAVDRDRLLVRSERFLYCLAPQ